MITQERLKAVLSYDQETGKFTRLVQRGAHPAGQVVGCIERDGYEVIHLSGKLYRAHRLAWLYMTGAWPERLIDHINGQRADNRWANLREVVQIENLQNSHKATKRNTSGYRGVSRSGPGFVAEIHAHKRRHYLGYFTTAEAAHEAYKAAKARLHFGAAGAV